MEKVNKKLAEIMSQFGGGEHVYSKYRPIEIFCIFISRWKYTLTYGIFYKIKYSIQRIFRGYDDLDKWNAAWYIARKAIPVLTEMRNNFKGTSIKRHREDRFNNIVELSRDEICSNGEFPDSLTEEEWRAVLDEIIFAFQFTLNLDVFDGEFNEEEYNKNYKRQRRGLKLFSIYYDNLWD